MASISEPKAISNRQLPNLALAAIGIVFGDIGTSPLYTMSTVFDPANGLPLNEKDVLGVISLILWSLAIVVTLKYVTLIMRADNHGEGGIMALLALASSAVSNQPRLREALLIAGVFGAALFYGDGVITPAISVLSAVEGLKVAAPDLQRFVLPISVAVLTGLFLVQKRGTAGIGRVFGPIMVMWFVILAGVGAVSIFSAPQILAALNPLEGVGFLIEHGWVAFVSLGAVVLALTGAEALYADMGHFGPTPIRVSWFGLVLPALALNYLGQGALLIANPKAVDSPFFHLFPNWALYPMVVLATVATIIASQAVISGAYSMTKQAIQLGFLPRMQIVHTSDTEIGQVYVPVINWLLFVAVLVAVLGFGSSTALGSAYGIAVTGTMLITTLLTFFVVRYAWKLNWLLCVAATGFFIVIDATFFSANMLKFAQGGWFPLLVGAGVFVLMTTWRAGMELVTENSRTSAEASPLAPFLEKLLSGTPRRLPGTGVFLSLNPDAVPRALSSTLDHFGAIHERLLIVKVTNLEVPYVADADRLKTESLGWECFRLTVTYGFKDVVDLPKSIALATADGLTLNPSKTSYFLSRTVAIATPGKGMWLWREMLFTAMLQNVGRLAAFFRLPAARVVEIGSEVEI